MWYTLSSPHPLCPRDYCCLRQHQLSPTGQCVVVTSATSHPLCPSPRGTWRVEDYSSVMATRPTRGPDLPGLQFSLTVFEDPGVVLPEALVSWVVLRALPDYVSNLRLACGKLRGAGQEQLEGLLLPDQLKHQANQGTDKILETVSSSPPPSPSPSSSSSIDIPSYMLPPNYLGSSGSTPPLQNHNPSIIAQDDAPKQIHLLTNNKNKEKNINICPTNDIIQEKHQYLEDGNLNLSVDDSSPSPHEDLGTKDFDPSVFVQSSIANPVCSSMRETIQEEPDYGQPNNSNSNISCSSRFSPNIEDKNGNDETSLSGPGFRQETSTQPCPTALPTPVCSPLRMAICNQR